MLKPMVLGSITDHYNSGEEIITKEFSTKSIQPEITSNTGEDSKIVKQISFSDQGANGQAT